MDTLSERYKVEYLDWEDSQGNCGTSYAIILEAESREEAEVELSALQLSPIGRTYYGNRRTEITYEKHRKQSN